MYNKRFTLSRSDIIEAKLQLIAEYTAAAFEAIAQGDTMEARDLFAIAADERASLRQYDITPAEVSYAMRAAMDLANEPETVDVPLTMPLFTDLLPVEVAA